MVTDLQKSISQGIINIFETSQVKGDYSKVVSLANDPGGLTYGRSQTTLMSGNLFLLIQSYCEASNAQFADQLRPYLKSLKAIDPNLNTDITLQTLLRKAGKSDTVMQQVQDDFFDRVYWTPALNSATKIGISTALGITVVYDSFVHGSWVARRDETIKSFGNIDMLGERKWINRYIEVRRQWLEKHPNPILPRTVYRMDAFKKLINEDNWNLAVPLAVCGLVIDEDSLGLPSRSSPVLNLKRELSLSVPYLQGEDVRQIQQALTKKGFKLEFIDGIFGPATDKAVKAFQKANKLKVDGIVGAATRLALGLDA